MGLRDEIPLWTCLYGAYEKNCVLAEALGPWLLFGFYVMVIVVTTIHALNQMGTPAASLNEEATARHQKKGSESYLCFGVSWLIQIAIMWCGVLWKPSNVKAFHPFQNDALQIIGSVGIVACMIGFIVVHCDLGSNWSPTPEVKASHTLVTSGLILRFIVCLCFCNGFHDSSRVSQRQPGIYRWARHPMYAIFTWLGVFGALATANWIIGIGWITLAMPTYYRIPCEEEILVELFGDQYRQYQRHVSALGYFCCCFDRWLTYGDTEKRLLASEEIIRPVTS